MELGLCWCDECVIFHKITSGTGILNHLTLNLQHHIPSPKATIFGVEASAYVLLAYHDQGAINFQFNYQIRCPKQTYTRFRAEAN